MMTLPGERSQAQEMPAALGEVGMNRAGEVSAAEPLFEGDYSAKIERLARVAPA
jgi:hypothetical protein